MTRLLPPLPRDKIGGAVGSLASPLPHRGANRRRGRSRQTAIGLNRDAPDGLAEIVTQECLAAVVQIFDRADLPADLIDAQGLRAAIREYVLACLVEPTSECV